MQPLISLPVFRFAGRLPPLVLCALVQAALATDIAMTRDTAELPVSRTRASSAATPGVQVLTLEDLLRRENLAEALKSVPGFRIRSQGGLGGYSEAWFRGSDGRQISVYLDGVPLNSSLDPSMDLGKIPLLMIREMEVDRGGMGADGDPEGGAAAIRLSTLPLGNAPVSIAGRLSSFGGQEAALAGKAGSGNSAVYLGAGAQAARNGYPFPSDNGTRYQGGDDSRVEMSNNAYAGRYLAMAWHDHGGGGRLKALSIRYDSHRKEYPGIYTDDSRAFTDHEELVAHARLLDSLPLPLVQGLSLGAMARFASDGFRDPDRSLGYASYSLDRESRLFSASLGLSARLPAGAGLRLGSRAGYEESDSREEEGFQEYPSPDARRFFAEPTVSLTAPLGRGVSARADGVQTLELLESENVGGIAGMRAPMPFERDAGGRTLRLAFAWQGDGAHRGGFALAGLSAEAEAVERLPALYEILGDNNGVMKNMNLGQQKTYGASLEAVLLAGPLRAVAGPFYQLTRGPIRLAPRGATNFLHFVNGADYRSLGWETRLDAGGRRWRIGDAFTASLPENLPGGRAAGLRPAYASHVENLADLSISFLPDLWMDVDWEFRTPYYPNDLNLRGTHRPAESLLGAGLRYRKRRLEAAIRGDNLGDEHYRDFAYSPKSGRRFSFRLSMNP